jgi:hypothetical protein
MSGDQRYVVEGGVSSEYRASVYDTRELAPGETRPTRRRIPCVDQATAEEIAAELNEGKLTTT